MKSKAQPLKEEIKNFYKFAEQRGFAKEKSKNHYFTVFKRTNGENVDYFDIQWDKYWRPYFVLNFGQGSSKENEISISGRLQRAKGGSLSCWFGLKKPLSKRILSMQWNYTPREVRKELESSFEELEKWWHEKEEGPHIYLWKN